MVLGVVGSSQPIEAKEGGRTSFFSMLGGRGGTRVDCLGRISGLDLGFSTIACQV